MSEQSSTLRKQSLTLPVVVGLAVIIVSLLYLIESSKWFSMDSPTGMIYQNFVGVLFFSIIFIAPILMAWKTDWPVWFIGLGCGFASTTLIQIGIHGGPADAEAIGSLLFVSFGIQSLISTGIALVTHYGIKKLTKK